MKYFLFGRLSERPIHLFDPKINGSFLSECIKRLLVMYNAVNEMGHPKDNLTDKKTSTEPGVNCNNTEHLMNALYLIINLGNPEVLNQASGKFL